MASDLIYIFLAFAGSISFGLTGVLLKIGMKDQRIFFALLIRSLGSVPFLIGISFIVYGWDAFSIFISMKLLILTLAAAGMLVMGDMLFMEILKTKPIGVITPLIAVNPLFTLLILLITGVVSITANIIILTSFIIIGVMLVTFDKPKMNNGTKSKMFDLKALVFGLSIALLFGTMTFIDAYILKEGSTNGISYTTSKFTFVGLYACILFILSSKRQSTSNTVNSRNKSSIKLMLLAGVVGWVIGSIMVFIALEEGPLPIIVPIIGINPLFAVVISLLLGMENLSSTKLVGIMSCIFCSVLLIL